MPAPIFRIASVTIASLLAVALGFGFAFPITTATGHQGDPNYRSELAGVEPSALSDGLDFSVGNYDDFIALSNRSGGTVLIEGYRGEPYLRFRADGQVAVNTRSPAWFANRDRYGEGEIPDSADPSASPRWKEVSDEGRFAWHDHRSHWMGDGIPTQVSDRSVRTEVFEYSIPMRVDGSPAQLRGTLFWVGSGGEMPVWPFLLLGGVAIAGMAFLLVRRRSPRPVDEPHTGGA